MPQAARVNYVAMDHKTIESACSLYCDLRKHLPNTAKQEVERILKNWPIDPRNATAEQAWPVIWTKPLFANTRVAIGQRWINELTEHMPNAWRTWGLPNEFRITRNIGSFAIEGAQAHVVRQASRVPIHRLYAVQGAAELFRKLAKNSPEAPVQSFWADSLEETDFNRFNEFGWGWGPITILHMLTDFGVACKPDIHVIRSLRYLGIWKGKVDQATAKEALAVNKAIRAMVMHISQNVTPSDLRRIDIELMHLSKNSVIRA
jgi:hypothetical protein